MEIPSAFTDLTFSMEIMKDPVSTPQGHTFEREQISDWVRVHGTCPITRQELSLADLTPNRSLRAAIEEWLVKNEDVRRKLLDLQRARQELQRKIDLGLITSTDPIYRYIDPINRSIMVDPVTAEDGNIYERRNIELFLATKAVSPVTREPMGGTLVPNSVLKREIQEFVQGLQVQQNSAAGPGVPAQAVDQVESVQNLNRIFAVMDDLEDILQEVLNQWQPPRIVVIGNQSEGKSTILERLCMMPLFPRSKGMCTRVPIKINIRRSFARRSATLELWDVSENKQIGKTQLIPLDSGEIDIRSTMTEAIRAQNVNVSVNREVLVCISSPTLPPMNLVDLPGTVEVGSDKEPTHSLVREYIDREEHAMFIVVVKADGSPTKCSAFQHISELKTENRTIGCFTFCDKMDSEEEYDMLRSWLSNSPEVKDSFPLEPYGYVATMNKPPAKKADEPNLARLMRQAQKERDWFQEEGFHDEVVQGKATTIALVSKLESMYTDYVMKTFLPKTIGRLGQELLQCRCTIQNIGTPPSPGDLKADSTGLNALQNAAKATALHIISPCFEAAVARYTSHTLAGLKRALLDAILETTTVGIRDVEQTLSKIQGDVVAVCRNAVAELGDEWTDRYTEALSSDEIPFKLQRFPQFVAKLMEFCSRRAPRVPEQVVEDVSQLVGAVIASNSHAVDLEHNFEALPATVTVRVIRPCHLIGRILNLFATGFEVPQGDELEVMLGTVVVDVFGHVLQEREACHAQRSWLLQREAQIIRGSRRLLQLVDPDLPMESDEPLDSTVQRVLPEVPEAMMLVDLTRCVVQGCGSADPIYFGSEGHFAITTRRSDGSQLKTGGLKFSAVVRAEKVTVPVTMIDNGDGTYTGRYQVDAEAVVGCRIGPARLACCIHVTLNGQSLLGSPFHVTILGEKQDGIYGNMLVYNRTEYFTLPESAPEAEAQPQDLETHQIPEDSEVVDTTWADFPDIRDNVIAKYPWGTHVLHCRVTGSNHAYHCCGFGRPGQEFSGDPFAVISADSICLTNRKGRVLLRKRAGI